MRIVLLATLIAIPFILPAQMIPQPQPTEAEIRLNSESKYDKLLANSALRHLRFRNVGPTVFSGRVVDIDVNPDDPSHFYVAYASGGLWYTDNNGTTFTPVFEQEAAITIGDIAVDWSEHVIWVGTGENNSSRSSYAGTGIYKSTDKGKTWNHQGLEDSHHIGRILFHPDNSDILYCAVVGHLYSTNEERGIYRSMNGGNSWEHVLYVDSITGGIDIVIDPNNPDVLYAAMWERIRKSWNFTEAGPGSGIYKSTDAGTTWNKISGSESGFPEGEGVGRIGLAIAQIGNDTRIAAILDNYFRRPADESDDDIALDKDELREMSAEEFLQLDTADITAYLEEYNFPEEYNAAAVTDMVERDEITPVALVEYVEDANSLLFDTDVIGAEVYISEDDGSSWEKSHEGYLDRLYNTYGYYFGQIRIDPSDPDRMYILGVPILRSDDGGATWSSVNGENVHVDHHALWLNPERPGHLILGNDGGINISYDWGESWMKCNSPSVGQFYAVTVDNAEPYNIYGGLQDNGVWGGPHTNVPDSRWHSTGQYPFKNYLGGDGMQVQIDPRDNNTMYTGLQFGNYYRIDMKTGKRQYITPKHALGERPLRWNWQTPILISRHQPDIVYMGSNYFHRSFDQGRNFDKISPDLTYGGLTGDVPFGTITTIDESPIRFGLLFAGTDDGLLHVSRDMGNTWKNISETLPDGLWVSRVQASMHDEGRVYCSLNGYRSDDFTAYVFVSDDYGDSWRSIADDLPAEPVNVIKEDPHHPNLLYVGTDNGLYVTMDRGKYYHAIGDSIPRVPIHDLVIHPKEKDLVLGTHGRSLYVADLDVIYAIAEDSTIDFTVVPQNGTSFRHSARWGTRYADWSELNTPEMSIAAYSSEQRSVQWHIDTENGTVQEGSWDLRPGISYPSYDLTFDPERLQVFQVNEDVKLPEQKDDGKYYLPAGKYDLVMQDGDSQMSIRFEIKQD